MTISPRIFEAGAPLPVEAPLERTCVWTITASEDYYESSCGLTWVFPDSHTPGEHGMRFCCGCGHPLVARPVAPDDAEVEEDEAS